MTSNTVIDNQIRRCLSNKNTHFCRRAFSLCGADVWKICLLCLVPAKTHRLSCRIKTHPQHCAAPRSCVCPSQIEVLPKQLNLGSRKHVSYGSPETQCFLKPKISTKIQWDRSNEGAKYTQERLKSAIFDQYLAKSQNQVSANWK